MAEPTGIEPIVERIETGWGEEITGTRRKHLVEVLEIIAQEAGMETVEEVAEWAAGKHPDLPIEQVRQRAAAEHSIGRDRFGFR